MPVVDESFFPLFTAHLFDIFSESRSFSQRNLVQNLSEIHSEHFVIGSCIGSTFDTSSVRAKSQSLEIERAK